MSNLESPNDGPRAVVFARISVRLLGLRLPRSLHSWRVVRIDLIPAEGRLFFFRGSASVSCAGVVAELWLAAVGATGCCVAQNSTPCASLLAAISQYRSLISIPIAFRPSSLAANRVVPDPANGSMMVWACDVVRITRSKSTGFS